jgi:hypothetical protein
MTEYLAWAFRGAREHTLALVRDLPPDRMQLQSQDGERHPTWLLGHLLLADTYLLSLLSVQALPPDFPSLLERYGPQSAPLPQAPGHAKEFLVEQLIRSNGLRIARVRGMTDHDLAAPMSDAFLSQAQPTLGHHLHSLVFHEGYHSGQLSSWRKAHGFLTVPWVFAPGTA